MKHLCALLLLCALYASCQKGDTYNTAPSTVQMGTATYTFKESKGIFRIPISVAGEQNGPIRVEIAVTASSSQTAIEDQHFYITSKTFNIPADKQTVNIEIWAIDDHTINTARTFTLQIVHADGAEISTTQSTCHVTLLDNDQIPYESLQGIWNVEATDVSGDDYTRQTWQTHVTPYDEGDTHYGKQLAMRGWMANGYEYDFITMPLNFRYNQQTGTVSLGIALGETIADSVNFSGTTDTSDPDFLCHVVSAGLSTTYLTKGEITGHINPTGDTIVFEAGMPLTGIIYNSQGKSIATWMEQDSIIMTMKKF